MYEINKISHKTHKAYLLNFHHFVTSLVTGTNYMPYSASLPTSVQERNEYQRLQFGINDLLLVHIIKAAPFAITADKNYWFLDSRNRCSLTALQSPYNIIHMSISLLPESHFSGLESSLNLSRPRLKGSRVKT